MSLWKKCVAAYWSAFADRSEAWAAWARGVKLPPAQPNRLPSSTFVRVHKGLHGEVGLTITVGFDRAGRVKQCRCEAAQAGSELQMLIEDACETLNAALEGHLGIGDLAARYRILCDLDENPIGPATILGTIAHAALDRETILRGAISSGSARR